MVVNRALLPVAARLATEDAPVAIRKSFENQENFRNEFGNDRKSVMRRPVKHFYEFGPFRLDPAERLLMRDGQSVPLTAKVFDILLVLVRNSGHLLEKEDLMKAVWPDSFVEEGNLTRNVSTLRTALGEGHRDLRYIETVPRRGYRFVASVREVGERSDLIVEERSRSQIVIEEGAEVDSLDSTGPAAAAREVQEVRGDGVESPPELRAVAREATPGEMRFVRMALAWPGRSRLHTAVALAALASAVTLVAVAVLLRWPNDRRAGPVAAGEIRTIAVLPLANLSGDAMQEYFADGMTDELITEIAKLGDVQVISRGSVMRFKNSTTPVPEIARQLDADAVLMGSVLHAGDRARITVQLIQAATDRHLWAESYERDLRDVLLLQRDIALNVGQQISARVAGQRRLAAPGRQIDPAAHEAYLKGLYYSNKSTPADKTEALRYFTEATRISPFYPEAHANIADCYLSLGGWYAVKERDEALAKARAAVTEALRQDGALPEAHVVLGYLYEEYEWDWNAAEREFRRAVELNPSNAAAHLALAFHLLLVGRLEEVPAEVERARSADPLSLTDVSVGAWILEYAGHHQEAVDRMKMVVQMDSNIPFTQFHLGLVYMDGGELDKAADQFRTAIRMYPAFGKFKAHLAFVLARSGDKQQARKLLDELMQSHNIVSFDVGLVMAGLGEQEQAIDWIEKAYQERSNEMIFLRVLATPNVYERPFYFLRANPRFKELLRRMNYSEP